MSRLLRNLCWFLLVVAVVLLASKAHAEQSLEQARAHSCFAEMVGLVELVNQDQDQAFVLDLLTDFQPRADSTEETIDGH